MADFPIPSPTGGEIDCLAVLWAAAEEGQPALKLSEIHERVSRLRVSLGEATPALTTVSTHLRNASAKGLLTEVRLEPGGALMPRSQSRGGLRSTRSPHNGYQATYPPSEVFAETFRAIAEAYPPEQRLKAVVDFAKSLDVDAKTLQAIDKLLTRTKPPSK